MDYSNVKILLVDDEPDILEILSYNLKKEKFQVFTAENGKIALAKASEIKPDLIILDIMMPEMDGVEVCRKLREDKDFDQTIITFLTARSEDFTQIAAFDYGGDDFINKPIKPGVFISRVKALLRRAERNEGDNLFFGQLTEGELTIIPEKFEVIRDNSYIELAKKEFQLLYLLASKPGKVFTREEIFNKIWGTDVIVGNRTIDVHIRKLREKVGEDYIRTIKGIGYKFESK